MPLQATSGAASYDAFGGGVAAVPQYIEDVFSTYLYAGDNSTQTITNGINLSANGGMVWIKSRTDTSFHGLWDTNRGAGKYIGSNTTIAQGGNTGDLLGSFNSNGFAVNTTYLGAYNTTTNASGQNYVSWTFRKQPKFFDVVTYSGSNSDQTISHNLGSAPGCIIIKNTTGTAGWAVYHRSLTNPNQYRLFLNTTAAESNYGANFIYNVTSTSFDIAGNSGFINVSGSSFVAYLFAHNAGGFGLTGTDNVISCGSCTAGTPVNLGYEPQWVMLKNPNSSGSGWFMFDNMRGGGLANYVNQNALEANSSGAESSNGQFSVSATGFTFESSCIYIAIRRGPMKVPTVGTSVFLPTARTGTGTNTTITTGFVNDSVWSSQRAGGYRGVFDRLRGSNNLLFQNSTGAEDATYTDTLTSFANNTGINVGVDGSWGGINLNGASDITYSFQRAPSFFDEVCYTGTGSTQSLTHNLSAVPELMIVKARGPSGTSTQWRVYSSATGATQSARLNQTDAFGTNTAAWNSTAPTSSVFTVGTDTSTNEPAFTFVAYLFATCAGVSKVGSYTGNGTTQTINCGFTSGARFVLIKRTDDVGNWYTYDTARGMTVLTDPYLFLNSNAAEVATLGSVTTVSTGFALNSTILAAINASGGSYIFLAVA